MIKSFLKKTLIYNLIRNPLRVSRVKLLKLYVVKEFVNECSVRNTKINIGVKSAIELFRCETYNTKEPETLDWIEQFKPGETLFDIGGNIGVYSLYAAKRGCNVFTFEPESQNFSRLVNNVSLNSLTQIKPYCMGIADKSELSILYLTSLNAGDSQHQVGKKSDLFDREFQQITQGCVVFSLNDLCLKQGLPIPDHIKIDVDGLESQIIQGAGEVLKNSKVKTVLIEINKSPDDVYDVQKAIESCGFTLSNTSRREFVNEKINARNYIFKKNAI
jgi:FkbM family methyltransferase